MADREIKTKLALEGAAEFKKQMSEAAGSMSVLNSQGRLIEAQFRATGDSAQYYADKCDNLKAKIETQDKAVNAAREALAKLKDAGFADNSKEVETWQRKLNDAETKLTNLQTELRTTQDDMTGVGEAAKTTGEQLEGVGKAISIEGLKSSLSDIEAGLESVVSKAAGAVKAVAELGSDAAGWADDLITESQQYGIDQEQIQRMRYASKFIDTEVSAIEGSMQRLARNMGTESSATVEAFERLGVSYKDADGNLRNTAEVFWEVIDALHALKTAGDEAASSAQVDADMMALMGRNAAEMNPLILAGSEAYRSKMAEANVVSAESVAALGNVKDAMDDLESDAETLKLEVLAELAPMFQAGAEALKGFADQMREFIQTEEGQAALQRLQEAVTKLIESLASDETIETIFDTAAAAVEKLTEALTWISEHSDAVVGAVKGIGAAFGLLKVSQSVLSFFQLAQNAKNLFGSGAGGAAANVAGSGLTEGGGVGTALAGVGAKAAPVMAAAAPWVALAGVSYLGSRYFDNKGIQDSFGHEWTDTTTGFAEAMADTGDAYVARLQGTLEKLHALADDENYEDMGEQVAAVKDNLAELGSTLETLLPDLEAINGLKENHSEYVTDEGSLDWGAALQSNEIFGSEWLEVAIQGYDALLQKTQEAQNGLAEFGAAAESAKDQAVAAADEAVSEVGTQLQTGGEEAGAQLGNGLAAGIDGNAQVVIDAARALANSVSAIVNQALDIRSPSHVMAEKGRFVAEGLAMGIEETTGDVERASLRMARAASAAVEPIPISDGGWGGYGSTGRDSAVSLEGVLSRLDALVSGQRKGDVVLSVNGREFARETAADFDRELGAISSWRGGTRA